MGQRDELSEDLASGSAPRSSVASLAAGQLLVTTATYNEIENLPRLVDAILAAVPQATVLIVDDNSPDGTGRWAHGRAADDSRVRVIQRPGKLGLGSAIVTAMRVAAAENFQYFVNLDADFSHDPAAIPQLVAPLLGSGPAASDPVASDPPAIDPRSIDLVIGSRYTSGGRIEGWPLRRHVMSRLLNAYTRWMLRLEIADCSSGFRAFRTEVFQHIGLDQLHATGYAFHEEILWHLRRAQARVHEVPIVFTDRRYGHSKINFREALRAVAVVTRLGIGG